jgi:hypothetical protein
MDMYAAGRMKDPETNAGKIVHGTVNKPDHNCPFLVFDVPAKNWADVIVMIKNWVKLVNALSAGSGEFKTSFDQTVWMSSAEEKLKKLFQFGSMKDGAKLVEQAAVETSIDKGTTTTHTLDSAKLSNEGKTDSRPNCLETKAHKHACGSAEEKRVNKAQAKDESNRRRSGLSTEDWQALGADGKAEVIDRLKEEAKEEKLKELIDRYECQLCDEKFTRAWNLKTHVDSVVSAGKAVVWCRGVSGES